MLPSLKRTRSAPRNSTRFAAQYPARGHPCERFAAGLATRLAHHSGPRRLARPFLAEDLHLLFFRQLDWRTRLGVIRDRSLPDEIYSMSAMLRLRRPAARNAACREGPTAVMTRLLGCGFTARLDGACKEFP